MPELSPIHRHLRGTLTPPERAVVRRGLGGAAMRIGLGVAVAMLVIAALYADSRRAYSLAFDPPDAGGAARVVVRAGPAARGVPEFPSQHAAARLGHRRHRVRGGWASAATPSRASPAAACRGRSTPAAGGSTCPGWLREVLNGLRPVPRGIAKALLGDPDGVAALKLAFSDPAARGEILSALA